MRPSSTFGLTPYLMQNVGCASYSATSGCSLPLVLILAIWLGYDRTRNRANEPSYASLVPSSANILPSFLANFHFEFPELPGAHTLEESISQLHDVIDLDKVIVISGFGEVGLWGPLPLTRTVSKCPGMIHPCESFCSSQTWTTSTILDSSNPLHLVNLILWYTGTPMNGMCVLWAWCCKACPDASGQLTWAIKSASASWKSSVP